MKHIEIELEGIRRMLGLVAYAILEAAEKHDEGSDLTTAAQLIHAQIDKAKGVGPFDPPFTDHVSRFLDLANEVRLAMVKHADSTPALAAYHRGRLKALEQAWRELDMEGELLDHLTGIEDD